MTDPLQHKALAHFGQIVVEHVRDMTISQWDRAIENGLEGKSEDVIELLERLGPQGRDLVKRLIPGIVDTTLHQMMFMLEQGDVLGITVAVTTEDGEHSPNLNELSDGLSGDLVDWIPAFSKERQGNAG